MGLHDVRRDAAGVEQRVMNARIGRMAELEALLGEAKSRTMTDDARVKITSASEGLWMMHNKPGVSFQCGPYALVNVATTMKPEAAAKAVDFLDKHPSTEKGFSIPEVSGFATQLGIPIVGLTDVVAHMGERAAA